MVLRSTCDYYILDYRQITTDLIDDEVPGPGYYDIPLSSFGKHMASQQVNEPSFPFAGGRDSWTKVFISKAHSKSAIAHCGAISPRDGPIPSSMRTNIGASFGKSVRQEIGSQLGIQRAPGATCYDIRGLASKDLKGYIPSVSFAKASRFMNISSKEIPDAQMRSSYSYSSLQLSRFRYPFGLSHRAYDRVQIPGCEQEHLGKASLGPGPPLWENLDRKSTHKFGTAPRFTSTKHDNVPGPGCYRPEEFRRAISLNSSSGLTSSGQGIASLRQSFQSDIRNPPGTSFGKPRKTNARLSFSKLTRMQDRIWGKI